MFRGFVWNLQKFIEFGWVSGFGGCGIFFGKGAQLSPEKAGSRSEFRAIPSVSSNPPKFRASKCTSKVKGRISSNPLEFRATSPYSEQTQSNFERFERVVPRPQNHPEPAHPASDFRFRRFSAMFCDFRRFSVDFGNFVFSTSFRHFRLRKGKNLLSCYRLGCLHLKHKG